MAPKKKAAKTEATENEAPVEEAAKAGDETAAEPVKEVKEEKAEAAAEEKKEEEVKKDEEVKAEADGEAANAGDEAKEEEVKEEEVKKEEPPAFKEEDDAPEDTRKKINASTAVLDMTTATPNVMASEDGAVLMTLVDGGCQYLLAGAKSSIGVKAGRYMFEFKILEMLSMYEGRGGRTPQPKQLVRVGFSLSGSDSLLVDGEDQVFFDSEGNFVHQKEKKRVAHGGFRWGQTIGVLLNLDENSPHKNTVSLFRNGERFSQPQALPESFAGKTLFPVLSYKSVTLQMNWGPSPMVALPFKCRMLLDAAAADVEVATAKGKAEKPEVLFPVGIPNQGLFDYVDQFLEEHPQQYLELSDRKVISWAQRSGVSKSRGQAWAASNDKPGMNFNIPAMDDFSAQKALLAVAPALKRNFVCMELNANLQAAERAKALKRFPANDFKRVALVAVGEPAASYKDRVHKLMLAEKTEAAEREKKKLEEEKARKKWYEQQDSSKKRKAQDEEAKEGDEAKEGEGDEEKKEDDKKEEEKEEEKPVELTDEEKAMSFRKLPAPDITPATLTKCFANYSIPAKAEGFDEIRCVWSKEADCSAKFKEWLLENKRTQRIEDLAPSAWFKEKWDAWNKTLAEWTQAQNDSKDPAKLKAKKAAKKAAESKDAEKEEGEKTESKEEDKEMEIDEEEIDVYEHADINDIGNGKPLFGNFEYEDWTLLSLRYELHLLVHAFRHDVADPDRESFHESHLLFYFEKYFGKTFDLKLMKLENFDGLCELISESVTLNKTTKFLEVPLPEDTPLDKFLRHTENHRRERQQCVDAGDESASLKFDKPPPQSWGRDSGRGYGRSSGGRDQQWDRNSSRGGSDRNSSWSGSGYGDRGSAEKRHSAAPSSSHGSKYARSDPHGGSSSRYERSGGGYDRRSHR